MSLAQNDVLLSVKTTASKESYRQDVNHMRVDSVPVMMITRQSPHFGFDVMLNFRAIVKWRKG